MAAAIYNTFQSWTGTDERGRTPTLYDHLVAGNQDLLPVAGLGVLQDGCAGLGRCGVGHGQRLQALHAVRAVVRQLDGSTLSNGDCSNTIGVRMREQARDIPEG